MLEGASPLITGFEVAGRRPLDFKSYATSVEELYTIRKKYEGMAVYIEKSTSDDRTGKWYTLKTLAECGLTQATINNWGTAFTHWKPHGSDAIVDLSAYVLNSTAGETAIVTISQSNQDAVSVNQEGKGTLNSVLNQIIDYVKANLGDTTEPISVVDQVEEGNANPVTSNAVALVVGSIVEVISQIQTSIQALFTALESKADLVNGKVPASQLPAYVDDVIDYDTYDLMVAAGGQKGFIYVVTADTVTSRNGSYRWSGSTFVKIDSGVDLAPYTRNVDGGSTLQVQPEADVADQYTLVGGKGLLNSLFSELSRKVKVLYSSISFRINTTLYFRIRRNSTTVIVGSGVNIIPLGGLENFDNFNLNVTGAEREVIDISGTFYDGQYLHFRNTGSGTLSFSHGTKFQTDGTYPIKLLTGDVVVFEFYQGVFYQLTGSYFRAVSITLPGGGGTAPDLTPYTKNADGGSTLNVTPESDVADQYTLASGKGILDVLFSSISRKVKTLYAQLSFSVSSTMYFRLKRNSTTISLATGQTVIALGGYENFDVFNLNVSGSVRDITDITGTFYNGQLLHFRNTGTGTVNFVHGSRFNTDGTYAILVEPKDTVVFEFYENVFYQVTASYYRSVAITLPGGGGTTPDLSVYVHKTTDKGTLAQVLAADTANKYVDTVLLNTFARRFNRIGQGQTMDPFSVSNQLYGQDIPGNTTVYPATFFFLHNPTENCVKSKFLYVGPNDNSGSSSEVHGDENGIVYMYALVYDDENDANYERVFLNETELSTGADVENISDLDYWKIPLQVGKSYIINLTRNYSNTTNYYDIHVFQLAGSSGPSGDFVDRVTDQSIDGIKTFLKTLVSNTQGGAVIEQAAWDDLVNEETYRKMSLYMINRASKEILVSFDAAEDLAGIMFSDPDLGNQAGMTFGVAATINAGTYKGVNMCYSRGGLLTGSLRLFVRDNLSFINTYFTRAISQKIGSFPNNIVVLNIASNVVTIDLGAFTNGRAILSLNQNVTFAITNAEENHEYKIFVTTDATARTIALPANSFNRGSLTLDASSRYEIYVYVVSISNVLNYIWKIEKIDTNAGGGGTTDLSNYVDKTTAQSINSVKTFDVKQQFTLGIGGTLWAGTGNQLGYFDNSGNLIRSSIALSDLQAAFAVSGVTYVSKNGNDSTGIIGRIDKPFLTITAAIAASPTDYQIIVFPGTYTENLVIPGGTSAKRFFIDLTGVTLVGSITYGSSGNSFSDGSVLYGNGSSSINGAIIANASGAQNLYIDNFVTLSNTGSTLFSNPTSAAGRFRISRIRQIQTTGAGVFGQGAYFINNVEYITADSNIVPGNTAVSFEEFYNVGLVENTAAAGSGTGFIYQTNSVTVNFKKVKNVTFKSNNHNFNFWVGTHRFFKCYFLSASGNNFYNATANGNSLQLEGCCLQTNGTLTPLRLDSTGTWRAYNNVFNAATFNGGTQALAGVGNNFSDTGFTIE
jgi:hypothetical protein